jgi:glucan phosphorylase
MELVNEMEFKIQNIFPFQQGKVPSDSALKRTMKEEKIRKKDDKSVEQVLKALNSLETTEEKLAALCKKYTDIVDENRKLQVKSDVNVYFKFLCDQLGNVLEIAM